MKNHLNKFQAQGKQKMHQKKSFLAHAVLASTVFCLSFASSATYAALTPLDAGANNKTSNDAPYNTPANGYNFIANNVGFFIIDGTPIGNTGGVSVDANAVYNNDAFVFNGSSVVSGSIGTTNPITSILIDDSHASTKTVELKGPTVNAGFIFLFNDNLIPPVTGTTLKLNNSAMVFTAPIFVQTDNRDTLNIFKANTLNGNIGTLTNRFNLVQVGENGDTTINGNIFATTTQFNGPFGLTLASGKTITGDITTLILNGGVLDFAGNGTVTGAIGTVPNSLGFVRLHEANTTVNVGNVSAVNLFFTDSSNADTTVVIKSGSTITANVDNTTTRPDVGTLIFLGDATVTGAAVGSNFIHSLHHVDLNGAGKTVTFQTPLYNVKTTNFTNTTSPTSEIVFNAPGALTINSNVTTANNNIGVIDFDNGGATTVNGSIGTATNKISQIILDSPQLVTFNNPVFANSVLFKADGTLRFNDTVGLGPITTLDGDNTGTVIFSAANTHINSPIGSPGEALKQVTFIKQVLTQPFINETLSADVFAQNVDVGPFTILNITNNPTVKVSNQMEINIGGALSISNDQNLKVNGNLSFDPLSVYLVDMNGNLVTTGKTVATGVVTTIPNYFLGVANPGFSPGRTTTVPILQGGPGTNLVQPIITNPPSLLTKLGTTITGGGTILNLTVTSTPSEDFANQGNTEGVAGALDQIALGAPTTDGLKSIIEQLYFFTDVASLNNALATLAPIVDGAILYESFNTQNRIFGTIGDRMDRMNFWRLHLPNAAKKGVSSGDETYAEADAELGAWAKVFRQHGNQKERDGIDGYQDNTWGVVVGGDTMITEQSLIGASFSWAYLDVNNNVSVSKTTADSYQGTIYGTLDFDCPLFANGSVGVSYNNYIVARNIVFNNIDLFPRAHFHGLQTGAKAEMGYVYTFKARPTLHAIPVISTFYSDLNLRGYQETGAGTAGQLVQGADFRTLLTGGGIKLADDYALSDYMLLQTEVHAMAFYDLFNDNMQTTSQFAGAGPSFATVGATPARASYNFGASAIIFSHYNFNVTADYDFNGKSDYTSHTGFFKIRYEFAK